jgi:hypothetical protein
MMARVFVLVEDETGRQTGRGADFKAVLSYVLRDAGPSAWRGTFGLTLPIEQAAAELAHTYEAVHLAANRHGPKSRRPLLHAVLGWHASDLAWLTGEHLTETVQLALTTMGLRERQAVWVTHTDTGRPHVHIVANLVHPKTGDIARLGLIKKRMSTFCGEYEKRLGDIRCRKRLEPKADNESRQRRPKPVRIPDKLKASFPLASRP